MSYRDTDNPLEALSDATAFNSRDFANDKFEAWIWGIVNGWDDEDGGDLDAMPEVAAKVGWTEENVARLRRLRANFRRLEAFAPILLRTPDTGDPADVQLYAMVGDLLPMLLTSPRRVIGTVEELEALPDQTVIRTRHGGAAQKSDDVWEFPNEIGQYLGGAIDLPVTVLWTPEEANHA